MVLSPFVNKHVTTKTKVRGNVGTAPRILTLSISHRKWLPYHLGGSTLSERASGIHWTGSPTAGTEMA